MHPSFAERSYMEQQDRWRHQQQGEAAYLAAAQAAALASAAVTAGGVAGSTSATTGDQLQYDIVPFEVARLRTQSGVAFDVPLPGKYGDVIGLTLELELARRLSGATYLWVALACSVTGKTWSTMTSTSNSAWIVFDGDKPVQRRFHGPFTERLGLSVFAKYGEDTATGTSDSEWDNLRGAVGVQRVG